MISDVNSGHKTFHAANLLLSALNNMIAITTNRAMAARIHLPWIIYYLMFVLGLGCSLLAGYGSAEGKYRSWIHIFGFTVIIAICLYIILDIEYPRVGFIRLDAYDQVLVGVRESMK